MKAERQKTTKKILVRYQDGLCWEAWEFRFNRGSKKGRPVKFFADRIWRLGCAVDMCPFDGIHFDSSSEREAESSFAEQLSTHKGVVISRFTKEFQKELNRLLDSERVVETRPDADLPEKPEDA